MEHVADMVDLSTSRLLLHPPVAKNSLYDLLKYDCLHDLGPCDEVARLDLCALVDAIFVKPFPLGDVENVEEDAESPVSNDRDCESEKMVVDENVDR